MNRRISIGVLLLLFLLLNYSTASAQQRLKFSVKDFSYDAFDQTARDERFKKIDGSGSLYAIVKVKGDSSDDDLLDYRFNFGNMNHLVEDHDGELWLYVQKNAKKVTISRSGYITLSHYDLRTTLEEGKVYRMVLSAQGPVVYTQMVMFTIKPIEAEPVVTIKGEEPDAVEQILKKTDSSGSVAKNLPYGTYTYRIISENYYPSEGRITLNDKTQTYREEVTLRPRFSSVTLQVDADAEIFVNGEKMGVRTWSGMLNAGVYNVECRQQNHKTAVQSITVEENTSRTYNLTPPLPITGTLSVISDPLGASIKVDDKDYGETPCNISDLLVGKHTVTLNHVNYNQEVVTVDVKENEITEINLSLKSIPVNTEKKVFTVNGVNFVMMYVEGGTFTMGATSEQGSDIYDNEKPAHQVTLNSYYMGETEVTQELWKAVMGSKPSEFKGSNLPVERVSWNDCQEFIRKLNALTGQNFRLPTEAEWEYAGRGGVKSRGYKYCGSNNIGDVAWYKDNSGGRTHAVKTKFPNELGLYDMSGNVHEWCQDWYGSYRSSAQTNPTGTSSGPSRVLRCGCWNSIEKNCRVSSRSDCLPTIHSLYIGLRLALDKKIENNTTTTPVEIKEENAEVEGKTPQQILNLGDNYFYGNDGKTKDYAKALKYYHLAAERGEIKANVNIGYMYGMGYGVEKNYSEAVRWYRKAAEQGYAYGQHNLGYMYYSGYGVIKNYVEAVKWYRKAAEQGHKGAQCTLGYMYNIGQGVEQDYTEAAKWYRKAAEQGDATAQNYLGYLYNEGYGVKKDYMEAVKWYRKAAEQGEAAAQSNLGYMYDNGYGVEKDYAKAVIWFLKSAEQGNIYGEYNLAECYQLGKGVTLDLNKAKFWYKKSSDQGYEEATKRLRELQ